MPTDETFWQTMSDFPVFQIATISLVRFAEPMAFTSFFPYVYYMVKSFEITDDEAQIAKYSGYLSSCFSICEVLTSYHWGKFSDRHGRKPTLILGLCGSISSLLVLGFARNFYVALLARSMLGLLNGNLAVVRTTIGEIATQRKHQAIAFSVMPLGWQIGCVIGPLIGGYLAGPDATLFGKRWPISEKHPYALPNLIVCALMFCSVLIAMFALEETHYRHKTRHDYFIDAVDSFRKRLGFKTKVRAWHKSFEYEPLVSEHGVVEYTHSNSAAIRDDDDGDENDYIENDDDIKPVGKLISRRQSITLIRSNSTVRPVDTTIKDILTPNIVSAIFCGFILSLHLVVMEEFLPVYLSYDTARQEDGSLVSRFPFKLQGGLSYSSEDTGSIMSLTGCLGIFVMCVVFPWVDRNFDAISVYRVSTKVFPFIYIFLPYVVLLGNYPVIYSKAAVYFFTSLKTTSASITFPQILLIIHNAADPKCRAMVNGLTISTQAFARFIGPLVWGILMTWGQQFGIGWLGWWLLGVLATTAVVQSYWLKID